MRRNESLSDSDAQPVMSNRSVVMRDMSWPIYVLSKYENESFCRCANMSRRISVSIFVPMMWPIDAMKNVAPTSTSFKIPQFQRRQTADAAVCDLLHDDWQRQLTHGRQRRAEQVENEDPQILFKVRRKTAYKALSPLFVTVVSTIPSFLSSAQNRFPHREIPQNL